MDRPVRSFGELTRRSIRSMLPRGVYGNLAQALDWSLALRKLGLKQCRQLWKAYPHHTRKHTGDWVPISSPNLAHPFYLREGTSDANEFLYTVIRESYGRHLPTGEVKFILDAGANVGDTAAWLLTRFPEALLIAVEPDPENFAILQKNCAPYGQRSFPIEAAVWPQPAQMSVSGTQSKDAVSVREDADGDCVGITIPELMERYGFPRLDIFKCDIEGAELQLFSQAADEWLSRTAFIVIETHGPECLGEVLEATARHGFTHREFRNLHILERSEPERQRMR